jgi:4-hydroxybenzoate polyprenyltransferase
MTNTADAPALSPASPFVRRWRAYLAERFPPLAHGVMIVSYYSANQFLAQALTYGDRPLQYSLGTLLGALTVLCIFFHLRVFDEHKDYADDCRHYPERVLQRGIVTLGGLARAGAVCIALELAMSAFWRPLPQPAALVAVLITLGYSLLMRYEFFVPELLRRHFLVYAVSHMLIMPLLAMVVYGYATGRYPWQAPGWFWLYSWVGFFVTFNWEISRKVRVPEDEREGVDSYSKIFGPFGAAYLVLGVRVIDTAMVALVGRHLGLSPWFYVAITALFFLCLAGVVHYRLRPTRATAKRLELYAGLYIVAFDAALAVELARRQGVVFRWWPDFGGGA